MTRHAILPHPFTPLTSFLSYATGDERPKLRPDWAHIGEEKMGRDFQELCEKHGLTCVSVMFYPDRVTVFPHWNDADGNDCCHSETAPTFDAAFAKALIHKDAAKAA